MAEFAFSARAGRYRNRETGRFVGEAKVRDGVDATVDLAAERMVGIARRLRDGELTAAGFQVELQAAIKDVHVAGAVAAYGGRDAMTPERWGWVGSRVRAEYGYARGLVSDIIDGKQPLNGRFDARVRQYASGGRVTYEAARGRQRKEQGETEERNVLHASESCASCKAQSSRGWVEIGALVPVGRRTCRGQCKCSIEYRGAGRRKGEAAA